MPRRPMRGGNRIWNQNNDNRYNGSQFSEHDDRGDGQKVMHRSKNTRRVSFKPSGTGPNNRPFNNKPQRNLNLAIRATLDDDDDMVDFPTGLNRDGNYQRNPNARIRRRGSPIPRAGHGPPGMRKLINGIHRDGSVCSGVTKTKAYISVNNLMYLCNGSVAFWRRCDGIHVYRQCCEEHRRATFRNYDQLYTMNHEARSTHLLENVE